MSTPMMALLRCRRCNDRPRHPGSLFCSISCRDNVQASAPILQSLAAVSGLRPLICAFPGCGGIATPGFECCGRECALALAAIAGAGMGASAWHSRGVGRNASVDVARPPQRALSASAGRAGTLRRLQCFTASLSTVRVIGPHLATVFVVCRCVAAATTALPTYTKRMRFLLFSNGLSRICGTHSF